MVWTTSDSLPRQLQSRQRRPYFCWVCVLWVMNSVAAGEVTRGNESRDGQKRRWEQRTRGFVLITHPPQNSMILHGQLHSCRRCRVISSSRELNSARMRGVFALCRFAKLTPLSKTACPFYRMFVFSVGKPEH